MKYQWWVHDPIVGTLWFKTEAEAVNEIRNRLDDYRDEAYTGSYPEDIEDLSYGRLQPVMAAKKGSDVTLQPAAQTAGGLMPTYIPSTCPVCGQHVIDLVYRDPRVDPRPGDVLLPRLVDGIANRRQLPVVVWVTLRTVVARTDGSDPIDLHKWQKIMANATVIRIAPEAR